MQAAVERPAGRGASGDVHMGRSRAGDAYIGRNAAVGETAKSTARDTGLMSRRMVDDAHERKGGARSASRLPRSGCAELAREVLGAPNVMLRTLLTAAAASSRFPVSPGMMMANDGTSDALVSRAAYDALQAELMQARQELAQLKALRMDDEHGAWAPDDVEKAFAAVDGNGDGVLTLDEFRKGYALLTGDAVATAFELMDVNGDRVLTKEEFQKGFALLTSDSKRAEAEREKVEAAVAAERIRAVQQAARNIAEAQLMDALSGSAGQASWPAQYQPVPGRAPLRRHKKARAEASALRRRPDAGRAAQ